MSDARPARPARQKLRLKILLPISIGLLIFLSFYIATTSWYLERDIARNLVLDSRAVNTSFHNLLKQRAQILHVQLQQLAQSAELQRLMLQQDRAQLLAAAEPTFNDLFRQMGISHYYFHNPDKTVFLRLHNPPKHGDQVDRYTLQQASQSGTFVQGIELDALGTLTLRAVIPWRKDNRLLGYLELGEEVAPVLKSFFPQGNTELALIIDKKYLNRAEWETGPRIIKKTSTGWDDLEDRVIAQTSIPTMLPELIKAINSKPADPRQSFEINFAEREYQGLTQPLLDASGKKIGEFLILSDVTEKRSDYRTTVIALTLLSLLTGGIFFSFTSAILKNTQEELRATEQKLIAEMVKVQGSNVLLENEIEERKTVESALNKIHNELEERVQERTEQLRLSLEQMQQLRKQLADVVTSVVDGLIVTDLEGTLELINPSAAQLFQCDAEKSLGQPLKTIIRDPALLRQMVDAVHHQVSDLQIEVSQLTHNAQKPIFLQARTSIITDKSGQPAGMIFLLRDITGEREVERIKNEFISTAVHELTTPLTAVMGYSELLLKNQQFSPEEQREFLTIINEKSEFLARLVGELLNISRIESGKPLELHKNNWSAEELFEQPIHHFRHFSADHPFLITIDSPTTILNVDKEKIWQVMENLCSNAVKYSPSGGEIIISGKPVTHGYRVVISDNGIGLTEEQVPLIFEKFYRCNQSDTAVGGTGLGLTIVKSIINAHDGKIWVDSEPGKGTSIHFELPCS